VRLRRCPVVLGLAAQLVAGPIDAQRPAGGGAGAESARDEREQGAAPGAGEESAPPPGVEEIVITGTAAAPLPDVRTESVVLFGAEELTALGIGDVTDLADFSPNLEIISPGETTATFFIRGVGLQDFSANAPSAVAIYQDDVPMNAPPLQVPQIFDVENVAVLRGPQGTGVGRNASAGAIKLISRKPNLDLAEASLRVSLGQFVSSDAPDSLIRDYEGGLGVPIVPEVAAGRVAFRMSRTEPLFRNGCGGALPVGQRGAGKVCNEGDSLLGEPPPIPAGLKKLVGDRDVWAARGQLRFQPPGSDMDWILNGHGSRRDQDGTFGQAIGTGPQGNQYGSGTFTTYIDEDQRAERTELRRQLGFAAGDRALAKNLAELRPLDRDPYRGDFRRDGRNKLDTYGTFVRGQMGLGEFDFEATTGWDGFSRLAESDSDFTPDLLFEITQEAKAWQLTQDLRLGRQVSERIYLDFGAYYLMEQLDSSLLLEQAFAAANVLRVYDQDIWSSAAYAGFNFDISEHFRLEGGARYNFEKKAFDITQSAPNALAVPTRSHRDQRVWHAPTGGISLTYSMTQDISTYWKYTRGWKSGHFNTNALPAPDNPSEPARPEVLDSFEWGVKASGLGSRLQLSAALFYYNYQDYQVFLFEDNPNSVPTLEVINADDAEVLGAESEIELYPLRDVAPSWLEDLVLQFRGGWLQSEFLDFKNLVFRTGGTVPFPVIEDYTGNQLPNAPRFQFSGGAHWTFDLGSFGALTPRYDFTWQDDTYFDVTEGRGSSDFNRNFNKPPFAIGQPAYWIHSVRLSWAAPGGQFQLSGWCRNLEDQRYKTYAFDASNFRGLVVNFVGDPRSCGGEVAFTW